MAAIGRGLIRAGKEILWAPARLNWARHELSFQFRRTPKGVLLKRTLQILGGKSPVMWNMQKAADAVNLALFRQSMLYEGVIDVTKIEHARVRQALLKAGIKTIRSEKAPGLTGPYNKIEIMVMLKRAVAGMEEGTPYTYMGSYFIDYPDYVQLTRNGSELNVKILKYSQVHE